MAENYLSPSSYLSPDGSDGAFLKGNSFSPEPGVKTECRRGRPKAAMITSLILEGSNSQSGIRCEICSRVFPRDKSLQAHLRVHTGERPYSCDYPGCVRKFKQSGQLKTHQRLHTGERPFVCSEPGCSNRFTHANRHCTSHPTASLIRCDDFVPHHPDAAQSEEVRNWLLRYMSEKREPKSEKKIKLDRVSGEKLSVSMNEWDSVDVKNQSSKDEPVSELSDMTNLTPRCTSPISCSPRLRRSPRAASLRSPHMSPVSPRRNSCLRSPIRASTPLSRAPVKSLFNESIITSPRKRELPKKRWLRIASREQESLAQQSRPTVLRFLSSPMQPTPPFLTPPYSADRPSRYHSDSISSDIDVGIGCSPLAGVADGLSPPYSVERLTPPAKRTPLLDSLLRSPHHHEDEELAVPLPSDNFDLVFL